MPKLFYTKKLLYTKTTFYAKKRIFLCQIILHLNNFFYAKTNFLRQKTHFLTTNNIYAKLIFYAKKRIFLRQVIFYAKNVFSNQYLNISSHRDRKFDLLHL